MKKRYIVFFLTVFWGFFLFFCELKKGQYEENKSITDNLTFSIMAEDSTRQSETIKLWEADNDYYYVFLPSFADISELVVNNNSTDEVYISGIKLTTGISLRPFSLDKDYELKIGNEMVKTIRFVQSENVSSMFISTSHNDLSTINSDKNMKEHVNICVYSADGQDNYVTHSYDDCLRGHGNSTWEYDKKSYNIYLNQSAALLNMPSSKDWVLLANALDTTNLRNKIAYDFIAEVSGDDKISPECEYVELFVDGEYLGLYLLCEKIQSIFENDTKNSGYTVICQNNTISKLDYPDTAIKFKDECYFEIVDDEKYTVTTNKQLESFLRQVDQKLYTDEWSEYVDMHSFAVKYLVEELFSNIDGASASQYYYWDRDNNRLYSGPCWDYDLVLGDTTWVQWISPENLYVQNRLWYNQIFNHEEFNEYYKNIYKTVFLPVINNYLESKIIEVSNSINKANNNNNIRWASAFEEEKNSSSDVLEFFAKHVKFLNSVWLEEKKYYKVSFMCNSSLPVAELYVPSNSSSVLIPSPNDMGIEGDYIWKNKTNGKIIDNKLMIDEDLVLYIDDPIVSQNEHLPGKKMKIVKLTLLIILALYGYVAILDCYKNVWKGRLLHGVQRKKV